MSAYYNEFDPYCAKWLRNLIAAGLIAPGEVDERSIENVKPDDVRGYAQCHFFAGIGGWSYALRLAGWPDSRPVWTGSCPCQPFSQAGARLGFADERNLWPAWFHIIRECRPGVVFGEQVEAAIRHRWLDLVQDDLEGSGYAFAPVCLPAASVGAPHIRQRLWFVADHVCEQFNGNGNARGGRGELADRGGVGDPLRAKSERLGCFGVQMEPEQKTRRSRHADAWSDCELIKCADGKARPAQPGIFPLAHGIPNRVGRLRAYGNAIVPQVAAEFITAYLDCRP